MIRLKPQFHHRVWDGNRLAEGFDRIGEAWVVYPENTIESGFHQGKTQDELVHEHGKWLLGSKREHHSHCSMLPIIDLRQNKCSLSECPDRSIRSLALKACSQGGLFRTGRFAQQKEPTVLFANINKGPARFLP